MAITTVVMLRTGLTFVIRRASDQSRGNKVAAPCGAAAHMQKRLERRTNT